MVTQTASRPVLSSTPPAAPPSSAASSPARIYGADPRWLAAHRGGMAAAPENTALAFENALAHGLTYLETDVRVTADGVPLAFHDRTLDRVTDLSGPVAAYTWAEISRTRVHGEEPVLALEDLLGSFPEACVTIDLKEARAIQPLAAAIRRTGSAGRVCVAGAWDGWLAAVRRLCGAGLTTALGWRALAALVAAARAGVRPSRAVATGAFAHVPLAYGPLRLLQDPVLAGRLVEMSAGLGVRVVGWTVNDLPTARRLLDAGLAGVITDRPGALLPAVA